MKNIYFPCEMTSFPFSYTLYSVSPPRTSPHHRKPFTYVYMYEYNTYVSSMYTVENDGYDMRNVRTHYWGRSFLLLT